MQPIPRFRNNKHSNCDRGYLIILLLFILLAFVMVRHSGFDLKSDGSNYFAYLRSVVFDHDLNFGNEFSHFNRAFWDTYKPKYTVTGHYTNVFSIGPALLWSPFYLLAHGLILTANLFGTKISANGFGGFYFLAINLGSVIYSLFGTLFTYKMCRKYFSEAIALVSTITIVLSTFILYYIVVQPYMSHAVSFFAVALFIYYWDSTRTRRNSGQSVVLGILTGLMMLVRWQNALFMILPATESLMIYILIIKKGLWPKASVQLKKDILFLAAVMLGFIPQMLAWKIIYGGFLTIPQGSGFLRWSSPFWSEVLFSSRHGLLSWSPIIYLAILGWLSFFNRDRLFAISGLIAFAITLYLNSVISDWWAGWGFGMRRFDGSLLLFALGLSSALGFIQKQAPKLFIPAAALIILIFPSYNFLLLKNVGNAIHPGGPVPFNQVFGLNNSWYKYTGYPFSFPANMLFSLRYGLSPARYDTLVGGYIDDPYFYGENISLTTVNQPLLGQGWSALTSHKGLTGRTLRTRAVIYAPILYVTAFDLTIKGHSPNKSVHPITLFVNGSSAGKINPISGWQDYKLKLNKNQIKPGINILEFTSAENSEPFLVRIISFARDGPAPSWK